MHPSIRAVVSLALLCLAGCGDRPLFKLLSARQTGITFANTITTDDSLNVQTDPYVYNGAGVGVGDIDNDGLPDLFFAGNMVSSRLYLNKGGMRFADITAQAGVGTTRWATGVTMADVNDDGYLDIYVSVSGPEWSTGAQRTNLLFINNGNRTFTEAAAQYAVADTGFTTHAAFLDYDRDGCLDLFLLENSPGDFSRSETANMPAGLRGQSPGSRNQLYRNGCHGKFINVSDRAGIGQELSYGLGVAVSDINHDGWPDIYVSNDVVANDVLYINNGNGTFTDRAARSLKHASFAGMGVDIADFNNDGWPDVLQVDMLPAALDRRKRTLGFTTVNSFLQLRSRGVRDDYSANSLQLSNGVTPEGDVVFSEIARLAGVSRTDWSWSPLFADFDDDGLKDIFIGNGYPKAVNDLDYLTNTSNALRPGRSSATSSGLVSLSHLPAYAEQSYLFRNAGDLTFIDKSKQWGLQGAGFSYGAAYADLDNDGKLDLVVNNIDAPASVYHNVRPDDDAHHSLSVRLEGTPPNRRGIGATLVLTTKGQKQYLYQSPYRGYMSTVDDRAHFGLGPLQRVDSLEVFWPDGRYQVSVNVAAGQTLVVKQATATATKRVQSPAPDAGDRLFAPVNAGLGLAYKHTAPAEFDYAVQPLLHYMISRQGPAMAIGDVDGNGMDDLFLGGGGGHPGTLLVQRKNGHFAPSTAAQSWLADSTSEDWGAAFFDANGDGRPDLYVASGGYQLGPGAPLLQDRLYVNRGGGAFVRDTQALPAMLTSTATVRAADFTGDGRIDVFVGGRLSPRSYPYPTRSYLLRNDGGRFTDVTKEVAPELIEPGGMVTDAVWIDFDGDGNLDLVTVGEWMGIEFYRNDGRRLRNVTASTHLPPLRGWWWSLAAGDFDHDGRLDLVAGNVGLNHSYTTSKGSPLGVYAADITGNRTTDVILAQTVNGTEYPVSGMLPLGRELYTLGLKFPTYGSFATATMQQLFTPTELAKALHYQVDTFASVFLHSDGGGAFSVTALPTLAQISPIKAILPYDVDGDGALDLLVAGNLFDTEPNTPAQDAGNGLWLRGDGKGRFAPVWSSQSGFLAPRNVSRLASIRTPNGPVVLVANTGDSLTAFMVGRRPPALAPRAVPAGLP